MSGLDVEALLESTANPSGSPTTAKPSRTGEGEDRLRHERNERRDRDRQRDGSVDRDRDRKRRDRSRDRDRRPRAVEADEALRSPKSDRGSNHNGHKNRRRSRSRDGERRNSRRDRRRESDDREDPYRGSGGDYYRGGGRPHTRSKSPDEDRYYRPPVRGRRERDDREDDRARGPHPNGRGRPNGGRHRSGSPKKSHSPKRARSKSASPQLTEDERDRRTVFVQQLAARLRTKELIAFFEKVGPVKEAQIVKDRVSGRSKGYEYIWYS